LRGCISATCILSGRRGRLPTCSPDPVPRRAPIPRVHFGLHSDESNTATIIYSEEQAHKGHDLYNEHCASCHGAALEGQGSLPLSGATFRARWADDRHSVDDLFYIVRTLMPYGQPATLSKQEYIDIIAYILMVNGYPAGAQPLPLDPRILKRITIKAQQP
jgi:S-disulfanyl-L-cysteine oxidoreductase SoxD